MMDDKNLTTEQKQDLDYIRKSGDNLLRLFETLFSIHKIENRSDQTNPDRTDVLGVLKRVVTDGESMLDEKSLEVRVTLPRN